jgi:hypothetical protein
MSRLCRDRLATMTKRRKRPYARDMTDLQPDPEESYRHAVLIGCLVLVGIGLIVIVLVLLAFGII